MPNVPSRIKMNKEGKHDKQIDIRLIQSYSVNLVPKTGVLGDVDVHDCDCPVIRLVGLKEAYERRARQTQCSSVATDRQLHHLKSLKNNTGGHTGTIFVELRILLTSWNFLPRFCDHFRNLSTNSLKLSHVKDRRGQKIFVGLPCLTDRWVPYLEIRCQIIIQQACSKRNQVLKTLIFYKKNYTKSGQAKRHWLH